MNAYPIDNVWRKGHYVARVLGPDPKFPVAWEFLNGKPVKTRGTVEYSPDDLGELPAWIVRTPEQLCPGCDRPRRDVGIEIIGAQPHGWETYGFLTPAEILTVWEAGPPAARGAWTGVRCQDCGVTPVFPAGPAECTDCEKSAAGKALAGAMSGADTEPF